MRTGSDLLQALRGPDYINPELDEMRLFADAVEEADGSFRDLIESECVLVQEGDGDNVEQEWWDTSRIESGIGNYIGMPPTYPPSVQRALNYLDRRGLLIRKEGEPHMVRFAEPS